MSEIVDAIHRFIAKGEFNGQPKRIRATADGRLYVTGVNSYFVVAEQALAAAGNYAANDVLNSDATNGAQWVWENVCPPEGGSVWLVGVSATCTEDSIANRTRIWPFVQTIGGSSVADNAAFAMVDTDRKNVRPYIDLPAFADVGVPSIAFDGDTRRKITLPGPHLYGLVQTLDAETNETAGMLLRIVLEFEQVL